MQQTSPIKHQPQQQSLMLPPPSTDSFKSPSTSTVFVAPRLINFQAVVPKPTTNIQIGNTKIILVSPSSTSSSSPSLVNPNPIKLVKFTPSSSASNMTLPKSVQIVLPSRPSNESLATSYRPLTKLATCSIDQIPPATQEVTITTSPPLHQTSTVAKPRRRSSTSTPAEKPVGKILRPIAKVLPVYSPTNSNHGRWRSSSRCLGSRFCFSHSSCKQRPGGNHSANDGEFPSSLAAIVFDARANDLSNDIRPILVSPREIQARRRDRQCLQMCLCSASALPPLRRQSKTDAKPISMTTTTGLSYEPKQIHNPATGGSVSVLACFKTTSKRNKVRREREISE